MYKKQFGQNITRYRKMNNMSQQKLGELLNTTKQNISSWEHDRTQPSNDDLERMAKIFHCEVKQITSNELDDLIKFVNSNPSHKEMIKDVYLNKEIEFIIKSYISAPDSIKDAVCKLLDVNREMFNISKYIEEGDKI